MFIEGTTRADLVQAWIEWNKGAKQTLVKIGSRKTYRLRYDGQRFGQYFWNQYGAANHCWPELFFAEANSYAFALAHSELPEEA